MKRLFNRGIPAACEHCAHGKISPDNQMVLCVKNGFMMPDSSCRSYKYDALKRRPRKRTKIFKEFSKDEFEL